ncbi:MAG TPA: hypothetical protein VIO61_12220 [Anaerolineaceae bacterium]
MVTFATQMAASKKLRILVFVGFTILAILFTGYIYGTHDQAINIPYLKSYADPELYPGDEFIQARAAHFSYFWILFQPFYKWNILEPVVFIVHFLSIFFTFAMFWNLSQQLFDNPLASLLVTISLIFPHLIFPGFPIIEIALENRTFVLPIALFGINLYLKKRYKLAFLVFGLGFNLHVLTILYTLMMIMFDMLLRIKSIGWKNALSSILIFTFFALPILIWRANFGAPTDFSLRPEWLDFERRAYLALLYDLLDFRNPLVVIDTLNLIGGIIFILIGRNAIAQPIIRRNLDHFSIAIGLVIIAAVITSYVLPITFIVSLQISRIGVFASYFGYLLFAGWLAEQYKTKKIPAKAFGILAFTYATFASPILTGAFLSIRHWFSEHKGRQLFILGVYTIFQTGAIAIAIYTGFWPGGYHLYVESTPWTEVQKWAKVNTPKSARFITPPQLTSFYISDWRVTSERTTYVTLVESMEGILEPDFADNWLKRFNNLLPGTVEKFDGNQSNNIRFTAEAYACLKENDFIRVSHEFQADYIVVTHNQRLDFPIAYQNQAFTVYDVREYLLPKP